jgi:hypothetical protein
MSERSSSTPDAAKASRQSTRTPPAWLISACMLAGAVLTIVLVVTGQ